MEVSAGCTRSGGADTEALREGRRFATAIVGGGCSGLLAAVQLFRNGFRERVTVIEPRERLGAGLAYSTSFDQHLLNVPAGQMSALADQPAHFLEWLRARSWPNASAASFAPRKIYGEYLEDLLQETIRPIARGQFSHIRAEAIGAAADGNGAHLALSDGTTVYAQRVVLALGNPASCAAPGLSMHGLEDCWRLSPWLGDALRVRFPGERILLLGTGLTAVDSLLALQSQDTACEVFLLSRRGQLPEVHDLGVRAQAPPVLTNRGNLRLLFRELRAHIEAAGQANRCWRSIIDGLRPISNDVWRELQVADRLRFLRHLKTYWEPHRHRMAPEIRARLDEYQANGTARIIAGRLQEASSRGGKTQVRILLKLGGERVLEVDRIISCTGLHEDYTASPRPLIHSLVENGLAHANDVGIGFHTDGHGALLDAKTNPSSVFFTLGPPRRGELFETTAVPEIRCQAEALVRYLVLGETESLR
ncbi:MAG: FAD/NAD(P)-binding protein [Bryobacteraceae bacterium]